MRQRLYDIKRQSGLYRYLPNDRMCVYCGEPEECQDHFLPISVACCLDDTFDMSSGKYLLPSCIDCNKIAGAKIFDTVNDKMNYIHDRICAAETELSDDELNEFGYTLRTAVINLEQRNKRNRRRRQWALKNNVNAEIAEINFCPVARGKSFVVGNVSSNGMERGGESSSPMQDRNLGSTLKLRNRVDREFFANLKREFGEEVAVKMMRDGTI